MPLRRTSTRSTRSRLRGRSRVRTSVPGTKSVVKMGVSLKNSAGLPASAAVDFMVLGDDYASTPPTVGVLAVAASGHVSADGQTIAYGSGRRNQRADLARRPSKGKLKCAHNSQSPRSAWLASPRSGPAPAAAAPGPARRARTFELGSGELRRRDFQQRELRQHELGRDAPAAELRQHELSGGATSSSGSSGSTSSSGGSSGSTSGSGGSSGGDGGAVASTADAGPPPVPGRALLRDGRIGRDRWRRGA